MCQRCRRGNALQGEMTAFLALVFILLIAFAGSLMESASIQSAKNHRRADMDRAMESVFAEYQKDLLEEYELLPWRAAMRAAATGRRTYLTGSPTTGPPIWTTPMARLQLLTDDGGAPFLSQSASG